MSPTSATKRQSSSILIADVSAVTNKKARRTSEEEPPSIQQMQHPNSNIANPQQPQIQQMQSQQVHIPQIPTLVQQLVDKQPPVNVVITSSDPLPAHNTVVTQPTLSVTIPPQHIKQNVQMSTVAQPSIDSVLPKVDMFADPSFKPINLEETSVLLGNEKEIFSIGRSSASLLGLKPKESESTLPTNPAPPITAGTVGAPTEEKNRSLSESHSQETQILKRIGVMEDRESSSETSVPAVQAIMEFDERAIKSGGEKSVKQINFRDEEPNAGEIPVCDFVPVKRRKLRREINWNEPLDSSSEDEIVAYKRVHVYRSPEPPCAEVIKPTNETDQLFAEAKTRPQPESNPTAMQPNQETKENEYPSEEMNAAITLLGMAEKTLGQMGNFKTSATNSEPPVAQVSVSKITLGWGLFQTFYLLY
jgi:hypothetical protein